MKFLTTKLDGRYTGSSWFKYRLEFIAEVHTYGYDGRKSRAKQHQQMLEWLWENYGPGCERDYWKFMSFTDETTTSLEARKNGPRWAWFVDQKNNIPYIYVVDDTTLAHIQLKWSA
jgi:hypothetical protein